MTHKKSPIGLFDSGLGGLTVMRELVSHLPHEKMIYFGDTARVPYGNKSPETILRYAIENTVFLLQKGIKLLIIPCNTATAFSLSKLRTFFSLPIMGVVDPGVRSAVAATKNKKIAILGTRGTIKSEVYQQSILKCIPDAVLYPIACPLFVPLVEEGWTDHEVTRKVAEHYLEPLKKEKVDTVLLGCTHYPLLKEAIRNVLGDSVCLVDSALATAKEAKETLSQMNLLSDDLEGCHEYFVSDDPHAFKESAKRFFEMRIENVSHTFAHSP